MKNLKASRTRTLLFLTLAAAAMGTAQAGSLEVGQISQAPATAGSEAFTFALGNHGAATANHVRVFVGGLDAVNCAASTAQGQAFALSGSLAAGDSVQCTGRTLAGAGHNTSITTLGQGANGVMSQHVAHQTYITMAAASQTIIGLLAGGAFNDEITANKVFQAGETISYSYSVYNFGNTALSGISVTDTLGSVISCPSTTLAVGAAMKCTSTHTITAAEAGSIISNTADVAGTGSDGHVVTSEDSAIRLGSSVGEIRGLKSPLLTGDNNGNGVADVGDTVTYHFAVKNSGKVDLNNVNVTEADASRIDSNGITCNSTTLGGNAFAGLGSGTLVVADSLQCTATYVIAQSDVDVGEADNLVNIIGTPAVGGAAQGSAASTFVVPKHAPFQSVAQAPVNDWWAMLLLGLGLLGAGYAVTYRKRQHS